MREWRQNSVTVNINNNNNYRALEAHSFLPARTSYSLFCSPRFCSAHFSTFSIPFPFHICTQYMQQQRRIHKLKSITLAIKSIATNYLSLKQMILKFFYVMIINFLLLVTHSLTLTHISTIPAHRTGNENGMARDGSVV